MSLSNKSSQEAARVILRHLPREKARQILTDLQQVKGNQSFKVSIDMILQELERKDV